MAIVRARMTEEEFLRMPDDGRKYELVDGEAKEVPTGFEHELVGTRVSVLLYQAAKGIGYVAGSSAGFRMDTRNIRCPDVSFTRKSRLHGERPPVGFWGESPDLCIEVISQSEDHKDMERKVQEYFDSGAVEVWQLFPETRIVRRFTSPTTFESLGPNETIYLPELLPAFRHTVADLFDIE